MAARVPPYGSTPAKRAVSSVNSVSALSSASLGISVESTVDQSTTIRRAISAFQPSGSSASVLSAALLI